MTASEKPPRILVIVPTYNEAENIEPLVRQIRERQPDGVDLHVLVVDDASADGTGERVEAMARRDDRVHLLSRKGKLGLGTAYIAGFRYALREGYDLAATMDADFSHDPAHLPEMIARADGADLVIGSRYIPSGGIRNWGVHRRLLSAGANLLARLVGDLRPHDCTTGYRLYRASLLERLDLDGITSHGYSCLMELVFECQRAGARIVESPIVFEDRRAGHSKISRAEIFKAFATLYHLALRRFAARGRSGQGSQR